MHILYAKRGTETKRRIVMWKTADDVTALVDELNEAIAAVLNGLAGRAARRAWDDQGIRSSPMSGSHSTATRPPGNGSAQSRQESAVNINVSSGMATSG